MTEPLDTIDGKCVLCRVHDGRVCESCRVRMAELLSAVPDILRRLPLAMLPGQGGGERVSSTREAPLPLRLAALNLAAGGSDDARCVFVPRVRVWASGETVAAPTDDDPHATVQVTVWHRALVRDGRGRPVMTLADDQSGVLPVGTWLERWALDWNRQFGHGSEPRPARQAQCECGVRPAVANRHLHRRGCNHYRPPLPDAVRTLLGLGKALPPAERPEDPAADEWLLRWGATHPGDATLARHRYLTQNLNHACDFHPAIADFAASLRGLVGAARAVLGDTEDLEYVGRCPEEITAHGSDERRICGAAIWHDPHTSVVTCPRCRAETPLGRRIWLARRILEAWPIDRRRRYHLGLIQILRLPVCSCGERVEVEWIDATERADRERFWRPGRVTCPNGCALEAAA